MPVVQSQYHEVREKILPGDVVAFSGLNNFSDVIKWATAATVSHVGIVYQTSVILDDQGQKNLVVDLMESTFLHRDPESGRSTGGVQRTRLCGHLESYHGHVWWLPLSGEARRELNVERLVRFLNEQNGKAYDVPQAVRSALDHLDGLPLLGGVTRNEEDFSRFFCSELVTAALEAGGVLPCINASEVTPIDLCTFRLYDDNYYLLKGDVLEIGGYNSKPMPKLRAS
jgi:hypothetical protein